MLILLIFLHVVLISCVVCVVNFTLCCSRQLLVCIIAPCCPARLYCLFYVFFCCVLSKINDVDDDDDDDDELSKIICVYIDYTTSKLIV